MAKTILVTGGARGIGLAVTRRLAAAGHRVAVSYRADGEAARSVRAELRARGAEIEIFQSDLADPKDARALPGRVGERFGGLDVLVNNAGMTDDASFLMMERARYREVLGTNLFGTMLLTGAALPLLLKADAPAIVIVASLGGVVGKEGQVAYATSKGALIGFTQWLARKYSSAGIAVNAVAPGFIRTGMTADLEPKMVDHVVGGTALRRVGRAEEVAEAVHFLLAPGYMQATTLRIDGGFNR
ncbi:SDR family NAD(P)-dependent oxidoreductase [Arenibaculum sp.]|jgi:3-oxoacyl-[acyl-carrier protein] reductase|uniref:SDR family NAD(P)-dependent oxidoreductase n=1 Tax=Arenibaculum sp. TaxID=2865862 RepID=UPI002E0E8765|nr:SDR family NAD(P)-dependent oxidoreductase [Arenibaculum sp.]